MIKKTSNTVFTKAIAGLIFIILLAVTIVSWFSLNESVELKSQQRFNSEVSNARERIQRRLATYEQILWGGVALFDSSNHVSRQEWRTFTETLQVTVKYPGVQGIGFSRMLLPEEKTAFETSVRLEGFPDFRIHPEGERERYSSIVYLEPFDFRNQRAFGYDMFSESVRREAMTYAAENGVAAISGRVTLLQETDTDVQAGFLMYLPVYHRNMALNTPEDRLQAVMGFVYSPFRMKDLMNGILGEGIPDVEFEIYDSSTPSTENLLYKSYQDSAFLTSKARYQSTQMIQVANRSWLLSVVSTPAIESEVDNKLPAFVLIGGLVIDLLVFIMLWTTASGRQRLEEHAWQLQESESHLKLAKQQLENALRKTSEANETNRQLYLKTLEIDELKTQFFANVSHELRTPLTLIIGPIQKRLKQAELASDEQRDFEMILRNARFLHRHVSNLLDIAKLDTHRMKVMYSETDLVHLIRAIASNFEVLASENQIGYQINVPEHLTAQVDVEKFQRILLNLLSNAFKFTPVEGLIRVELQPYDDEFVLIVSDSGPGVPIDQRTAVFDRFHQLDHQDSRVYGGTGLGLAIVKEFVLLMQGQIEITDAQEQGACFVVRLPLNAPSGTELIALQEPSESIDESYYLDEKSYARRQKVSVLPNRLENHQRLILIVEDNQDMQEYLRAILAPHYRLLMASNGEEGLQQVSQVKPDLILTDIMMPKMSGDQMINALREQDEFKNLPILVLSARSDEALRTHLFKNGIQDYIDKPFSDEDLLARIKRILSDYQHFTDAIELNEERYRFAFEASETGVWDWNVQTGKVEYSERWKEILGYHGDVIGSDYQEWESRLHPEDKERVLAELKAYLEGDSTAYTCEYRMRCQDGSWKWVASRGRIVSRDNQGRPLRIVGTQVDVDQQKQAEAFLLQAKESAEKAMQAKSNFLANMSHEIRTPMSAIMGFTELMIDTPLSSTQKDYLQKTRSASEDLLNIINDILDISKIDSGLLLLENHPFDPKEVLNNIAQLFSAQIKAKKLKIYLNIDLDIPSVVMGDDLRIRQVLKNLISNAVKFTSEGEIRIGLSMQPLNQETVLLCFRVEDTGIGIQSNQIDDLFQPFMQADSSITRQYGGTGLGLSICNQLVTLMGGKIEVVSELGRGSQFSFTVQVKEVKDQSDHDLNHVKQAHCLVVDHNETSRSKLIEILKPKVQRIDVAINAQASLEQIVQKAEQGQPFDLVFLDWQSDSTDSMAVMQAIDRNARKLAIKRTPVIVMVTETERHLLEKQINIYNIQPDAILNKPIESKGLLDVLQEISLRQLSQSARQANQNKLDQQAIESIQGARVLLVEDNLLNQQVVSEFLKKNSLQVTLANHGGEALQYMVQGEFDIILMDLQMPVMDGLEACREIRKLPQGRDIPVIAMTAAVMQSDRDAAARAGMNDFAAKPINPKKLLNTMIYWLNRSDDDAPILSLSDKQAEPQLACPDGFDFSEILLMLGGDEEKLFGLLKMFVEDYRDMIEQVDALLRQGLLENASKTVHKLTGISSNLGAVEFGQQCYKVELELQRGTVNMAHLQAWRHSFRQTLAIIKALLEAGTIKADVSNCYFQADHNDEAYNQFFALVRGIDEKMHNNQWLDSDAIETLLNTAPAECYSKVLILVKALENRDKSTAQTVLHEIFTMAEDAGL